MKNVKYDRVYRYANRATIFNACGLEWPMMDDLYTIVPKVAMQTIMPVLIDLVSANANIKNMAEENASGSGPSMCVRIANTRNIKAFMFFLKGKMWIRITAIRNGRV